MLHASSMISGHASSDVHFDVDCAVSDKRPKLPFEVAEEADLGESRIVQAFIGSPD